MNPCGEIEFLKKSIGSVLVSALAEVCLKRPTDPIDFIANWLIKYRYNEALRFRDTENAMRVFQTLQEIRCGPEMNFEEACGPKSRFNQGVNQLHPFLPPGYGMATEYVIPTDALDEEELGEADEYFNEGICSDPPSEENLAGGAPTAGQLRSDEMLGEDQDQISVLPSGQDEDASNLEVPEEFKEQLGGPDETKQTSEDPQQPAPEQPKLSVTSQASRRASDSSVLPTDDPVAVPANPEENEEEEEEEEEKKLNGLFKEPN